MLKSCCKSFARIVNLGPLRQNILRSINSRRVEIEGQRVHGRVGTRPRPLRGARGHNSLLSTLFLLRLFSLEGIQLIQRLKATLNHLGTPLTK